MKIGIVGSRSIKVGKLEQFIPKNCEKIITGGAIGVDKCAAEYAEQQEIELLEILPEYKKYGKAAPIVRNKLIVDQSDLIIAFWDGCSKGTKSVIDYCRKINKVCTVVKMLCGTSKIKDDNISSDDLISVEKRLAVFQELTKAYSNKNFEIVDNAPDTFCDIQNKLKTFSDKKNGIMEAEISIECLSAYIKIIFPALFLYKEDIDLLNDIQEEISELMVMSYHNKVKIIVGVPYFTESESPDIKAWKKLGDECEKNNIVISDGFKEIFSH